MTNREELHADNLRMLARWCQEQSRTATIYLYAIQAADFIEQSRAGVIEEPKAADRIEELEKALLMCAPSHQGGHSNTGAAIALALGVPFPLTVPELRKAATDRGHMPYDLWPWLETMENAR